MNNFSVTGSESQADNTGKALSCNQSNPQKEQTTTATRRVANGMPQTSGIADLRRNSPDVLKTGSFRLMRFVWGLLLSGLGMASILMVGFSLTHIRRFGVDTALPVIALSILVGIMLLGGGFGLMATASAGIADHEFQASFHGAPNPILAELCTSQDAAVPQTLAPVAHSAFVEGQSTDQPSTALSDDSAASPTVNA